MADAHGELHVLPTDLAHLSAAVVPFSTHFLELLEAAAVGLAEALPGQEGCAAAP